MVNSPMPQSDAAEGPCVGIEYGELDIRVALVRDGVPGVLPIDFGSREPKVMFDPARKTSSLGVGFASILQSVGTGSSFAASGTRDTAEGYVERHLKRVQQRVVEVCGAAPGRVTIAVPTSLVQNRRQALIECAARAGLGAVTLLDRSLAVALAMRKDKDSSGTFVVFDLGYGDCEYALTRVARGRCWSVGSAVVPRISGERLTAAIMEDIILALRKRQVFLGLKHFTGTHWMEFRRIAEKVQLEFRRNAQVQVTLKSHLTGAGGAVSLQTDVAGYAEYVRSLLAGGVDDIAMLLEQNGLESKNLDSVLLVGDVATESPVRDIVLETYPSLALLTRDDAVAIGALANACEAAGRTLDLTALGPLTATFAARPLGRQAPRAQPAEDNGNVRAGAQFSRVLHVDSALKAKAVSSERTDAPAAGADRIDTARKLVEQGRGEQAQALLDTLTAEIAVLTEQLRLQVPTHAQQLVDEAQALLEDQRYAEAVALSHDAYASAPAAAGIFAAMMRIHAECGLAMDRVEEYADALHILRCAHGHDQTNREIHRALAQRHYLQAVAMRRLNNYALANEALQAALSFDPKHAEANELRKELSGGSLA
jgi:tetratricopeptide (TPR) repeat protein